MNRVVSGLLAAAAILALYTLLRVVQQWDPSRMTPPTMAGSQPAISAENAVMIVRERGDVRWRLRVDRIALRKPAQSDLTDFHAAEFVGVREGSVYDEGRQVAAFSAAAATYERPIKRLDIRNAITFRTRDGEAFNSERCIWTEDDEFARFPEGAQATISGNTVTARNMLYSTLTRVIQCPDGAEAVFRGQTVAARALVWDIPAQRITCTGPITGSRGNVSFVASYAELDLKRRTLRVNKGALDLRIDGEEVGARR